MRYLSLSGEPAFQKLRMTTMRSHPTRAKNAHHSRKGFNQNRGRPFSHAHGSFVMLSSHFGKMTVSMMKLEITPNATMLARITQVGKAGVGSSAMVMVNDMMSRIIPTKKHPETAKWVFTLCSGKNPTRTQDITQKRPRPITTLPKVELKVRPRPRIKGTIKMPVAIIVTANKVLCLAKRGSPSSDIKWLRKLNGSCFIPEKP